MQTKIIYSLILYYNNHNIILYVNTSYSMLSNMPIRSKIYFGYCNIKVDCNNYFSIKKKKKIMSGHVIVKSVNNRSQ